MLIAYGPDNQPVIANETALELLQSWSRERVLHCPNCRGIVYVRGGTEKQIQVHFVHHHGECAWSTETESLRHMSGKLLLAQWLREQFPAAQVRLEERLLEPNRIADIFLIQPDGRQWAIEFQCAPLDYTEWRLRHNAYRQARILDIWIVGDNRREKQESFIGAIFATAHETLFLDPLSLPPRVWLRWQISSDNAQHWQHHANMLLEQRKGQDDYYAVVTGTLDEIGLNAQGHMTHPTRTLQEQQTQLLQTMQKEAQVHETTLVAYLHPHLSDADIRTVLIPLLHAYMRDPNLMRRYNYGRGLLEQAVNDEDLKRISKARQWLEKLRDGGYTKDWWFTLTELMPSIGPYAVFTRYIEMLIASHS